MGAKRPVKRPRAVLDTNVVLSALLFRSGRLSWIVEAWTGGRFVPLVSKATATELVRVLGYPKFRLSGMEKQAVLAAFLPYAETVLNVPDTDDLPACRDEKDVPFLRLAVAGHADYLVSGDVDLLVLKGIRRCRIISPDAFKSCLSSGG
jgi:putative PIN family toxin of toxin-antitoxin system